jgi:hypothetical protein
MWIERVKTGGYISYGIINLYTTMKSNMKTYTNQGYDKERKNKKKQRRKNHLTSTALVMIILVMDVLVSSEISKFLHHYTALQPSSQYCVNKMLFINVHITTFYTVNNLNQPLTNTYLICS